ncbi:MAG: hypothetical protein LBI54_07020, partial [Lachnospiraceae bacterium]|nr:hypothetical protein [Lachnospiraceae bacterium]
ENAMTDSMPNSAIVSAGMKLLRENLGLIECEIFISSIKQDHFDYTEWRENLFEDMTIEEINRNAIAFMREHPEQIPSNATII